MNLSDLITILITTATRTPSQRGFGIPMILSYTAAWVERVRTYSQIDDVAVDFATTTAEYKAAAKVFSQSPRPSSLLIGRAANKPAQQFEITPVVANTYVYTFKANGSVVTFTSDGSATAAEITAGLKAAFDALGLPVTSTQQAANATLRMVANVAGAFFSIESNDPNMPVLQNHADPGTAADLTAIQAENDTWYGLITTHNSKAVIDAAGAWIETAKKLYVTQTQDSAVRDTAISGTDDVGESTKAAALKHTMLIWSKTTDDFAGAAFQGRVLPLPPGSWTGAFKELASVTAGSFTATQRTNLQARNVTFYEPTAGLNMTWEAKSAQGQYIDTTVFLDWLEATLAEAVFEVLVNAEKVPYTDKGIGAVEGAVRGVLKRASLPPIEGIAPTFTVIVPKVADVPAADKATRTLKNVQFTATLTGAIHKVAPIQGTISV